VGIGGLPSTADLDQDFHVVLAGQEPLEPSSNMETSAMHHWPTSSRADGSYSVPFARAFPLVTASRRRTEHCKNPNAGGQVVWVEARQWGRVA
jgi:hypothetical protein